MRLLTKLNQKILLLGKIVPHTLWKHYRRIEEMALEAQRTERGIIH